MIEQLSAEILPAQPMTNRKWFELWWLIWKYRNADAFQSILQEQDHSWKRGFIWTVVTAIILGAVNFIFSNLLAKNPITLPTYKILINFSLALLRGALFGLLILVVIPGIYHGLAKLFHGTGSWSNLVFCISAVNLPLSFVTNLVYIPFIYILSSQLFFWIQACISLVLLALQIALHMKAVKVVEHTEKGEALIVIGPWLTIFFVPICLLLFYASSIK
jgi:hypothetical protein